jgi:hypothetical protein
MSAMLPVRSSTAHERRSLVKRRAQILSKDINFVPIAAQRRDKQKNFV